MDVCLLFGVQVIAFFDGEVIQDGFVRETEQVWKPETSSKATINRILIHISVCCV